MAPNISWPRAKYGSTGLIRGEPSGRSVPSRTTRAWSSRARPGRAMRGASCSRSCHDAIRCLPGDAGTGGAGSPADVGGVTHPVAGGGALPGDGDVDVDAEHAGEQGGGEFGGELEQRGGARLAGLDAEVFEALSQVGGSDRAARLPAGNRLIPVPPTGPTCRVPNLRLRD